MLAQSQKSRETLSRVRDKLGFWEGFSSLLEGVKLLWRLPRAWPFALVPTLLFLLFEGAFATLTLRYLKPWVLSALAGEGTLRDVASQAAAWTATVVAISVGWIVAGLLAPASSGPALEHVVSLVEKEIGAEPRASLGFWRELWCGLRAQFLGAALALSIIIVLTMLEFFVPPTVVITTPSKMLVGALGLAWGLFDYPLTLRGVPARERLVFLQQHAAPLAGFGCAFALAFWLPCCGVVLLPAGVAAATSLLERLRRADGAQA